MSGMEHSGDFILYLPLELAVTDLRPGGLTQPFLPGMSFLWKELLQG